MYAVLTQLIGWCGTALYIASFQFKSSRKMAFCAVLGALSYVIHYFMLGAYAGSISLFVSMFGNFFVACAGSKWADWKGWPAVFTFCYAFSTYFTWQGPLSLLPGFISALKTGVYFTRNGKVIRLTCLCIVSPGWMVYNVITGSWSGLVCELFVSGSILVSILRYGLKALDEVS